MSRLLNFALIAFVLFVSRVWYGTGAHAAEAETRVKVDIYPYKRPPNYFPYFAALWDATSDGLRPWLEKRATNNVVVMLAPDSKSDKLFKITITTTIGGRRVEYSTPVELDGKPQESASEAILMIEEDLEEDFPLTKQPKTGART